MDTYVYRIRPKAVVCLCIYSEGFKRAVRAAPDSPKPLLAIIHQRTTTGFIGDVKAHGDVKIFEVMLDTRAELSSRLAELVTATLAKK